MPMATNMAARSIIILEIILRLRDLFVFLFFSSIADGKRLNTHTRNKYQTTYTQALSFLYINAHSLLTTRAMSI